MVELHIHTHRNVCYGFEQCDVSGRWCGTVCFRVGRSSDVGLDANHDTSYVPLA